MGPLALALVAACSPQHSTAGTDAADNGTSARPPQAAAVAPPVGGPSRHTAQTLQPRMSANFSRVVMTGKRPATELRQLPTPQRNFGGMTCTETPVSPAQPRLMLNLPATVEARENVLAVLTPAGRVLTIYQPYGEDEAEDVATPSLEVTWADARTRRRFDVTSDNFSATPIGEAQPFAVFVEPGVYQFALVASLAADLIRANGSEAGVETLAGCTVEFRLN